MGALYKPGFTIIETLLFLALTGLLVAGVLAGTGTSINVQRYRDSVSTLKSLIAGQYSEVTNTRNIERGTDLSCANDATVSDTGAVLPRGQAECILIGRYMTIDDSAIATWSVVGRAQSTTAGANDIADLQNYRLALMESTKEASSLEWGARIAWPRPVSGPPTQSGVRQFSMLILRSPKSGISYTFTADNTTTPLASMIVAGRTIPGQEQRRICVDSNGFFAGGMAVVIGAYASGANAIEIRTNDMGDSFTC